MSLRKAILAGSVLFLALTPALRAQDEPAPDENTPKPAAKTLPLPVIDPDSNQDSSVTQLPDATPLTGAQTPTLGSSETLHSYWVPGVQYSSSIQSGIAGSSDSSWFINNFVLGNLSLLKVWNRSQLAINYSGGGYFSSSGGQGSGWSQQLALTQSFTWNRFNVQLIDNFSFLPQSQFGFGGGTNLGIPGVGGPTSPGIPGLGGGYLPNQSIYAANGPRYSNAGVIQATYTTSPRGSITATGSYGILRFTEAGNVDNNSTIASIGYNYILTKFDTIGVFYRFSGYQYPGEPQAFGDNSFNFAYGRKITGRLGLQIYGGPEYTHFRVPIGTETSKLGGNFSATLTYGFENGLISGGYFHGLTGGSGAFTGSTVDSFTVGFDRRLSRVWTGRASVGYSKNRAVVTSTSLNFPSYNSTYINFSANRPFGRNLFFSAAYSLYIASGAETTCATSGCPSSSSQINSAITLSIQWNTRPFVLP